MKNKKKLIAMLMTAAFTLSAFTACGSSDKTTQDSSSGAENSGSQQQEEKNDAEESSFKAGSKIIVMTREDGSGTRGAFIELTGVEGKNDAGEKVDNTTVDAEVNNSTSVMMTAVAGNPYAIGYISLGSLNDTVKALQIDGVDATAENIVAGKYALARPFNIAYKDDLSDLGRDFIDFIMSDDGQSIIDENGYIATMTGTAYAGSGEGKLVVAGSSSVSPVMEKLIEAYMAKNTGADIELQESDSSSGMSALAEGVCDIGMASRDLKDSELEQGLIPQTIATDGIAVIVNNDNTTDNLSKDDIKAIYTGEKTTW